MKALKLIAAIPWWVLFRLIRMERYFKDYDYVHLSGVASTTTRIGLIIGLLFWVAIGFLAYVLI